MGGQVKEGNKLIEIDGRTGGRSVWGLSLLKILRVFWGLNCEDD